MPAKRAIQVSQIKKALKQLDDLSHGEYGVGLEQLLLDGSPKARIRLQRLTGIALKRPFARKAGPVRRSFTNARRSWPWKSTRPGTKAASARKELALLNQLRKPGPWNERKPRASRGDTKPVKWKDFKDDVEQERGLFKVVALYVNDKLSGRSGQSLQAYLKADESRGFEAGLDVATWVFDLTVTQPLAAVVGVPAVVVGLALIGGQYGWRFLTDKSKGRMGDGHS